MRDVLYRLGLVAWWFGALGAAACLLGAGAVLFSDGSDKATAVGLMALGAAGFAVPSWAVSFVLAGSFWKPPRRAP